MRNRTKRYDYQTKGKGYYHFCTDGLQGTRLFYTPAQFAYGMILIGLLTIKYNVKVYAFVLMPNHIHIILSGTGEQCVKAFDYLKSRISSRLKTDGYPPLPDDYDFVLVDIPDKLRMKGEIIYVLRNPLEKNLGAPNGYAWGSGWLYHSPIKDFVTGKRAGDMTVREKAKLIGSKMALPEKWEFHPDLGLLPRCFVDTSLVNRLFPQAKDLEVALVKDYESYVRSARDLHEEVIFDDSDIRTIVMQALQKHFGGAPLSEMSQESKCRLVVILSQHYGLSPSQIARAIVLNEKIVRQVLASKEYGRGKT